MHVYSSGDLNSLSYNDSEFQLDNDSRKSTSGSMFTIGGVAVVLRSVKQCNIIYSTMETDYIATCQIVKE